MENLFLAALIGSGLAGGMTAVGAVPVLFNTSMSSKTRDLALGFAAGVMIAASFFSLIVPALDVASPIFGEVWSAAGVCLSILFGMGVLAVLNETLPHEHFLSGKEGPMPASLSRVWLFVLAITIHNVPEGLAVGVGFSQSIEAGFPLALGIGIQNMPEGLAVAVALMGEGYSRGKSFFIAALTGLVEPLGGVLGAGLVSLAPILPWALAFSAGAMLYVISHEIIPETHKGHKNRATLGLAVGLVLMLFLDVVLG